MASSIDFRERTWEPLLVSGQLFYILSTLGAVHDVGSQSIAGTSGEGWEVSDIHSGINIGALLATYHQPF